ncbi:MAG: glycosyltransferase family 2 protein [Runella sp.]
MDKVAIVILNYNGRNFLEKFLPSVFKYSTDFRIYIADNSSKDDSVAWLQKNYPSLSILQLEANYGYAGGYNRALQQINAQYYVLLNSDVEVTAHWLSSMIMFLDNHPQIAACQPKILGYHEPNRFEYAGAAGGYIDWLGYPYCRGRIFDYTEIDQGQYDDAVPIFWASGACLVIRAERFWQVGGFDEDFFAHMEEIDLCWRLHWAGYQIYCQPQSVVYHVGGGTLPASNPFKTYLNYRNSLAMLYKNLPAGQRYWIIFLRLCMDGISSLKFVMANQWANVGAIVKAHFAFYAWTWKHLPQKRRKIRQIALQRNITKNFPIASKSIVWAYFVKKIKTFDSFSNQ